MKAFLLMFCWFVGWFLFKKVKFLKMQEISEKENSLSVIIPARNEEENLPKILKFLDSQNYEIIVVDDNSQDNTAKIVASYKNVRLVSLKQPPPEDWLGKTWACWNGYLNSTGKILLFLDADVELESSSLESLLAEYRKQRGLISVWPYQRFEKLYEHLTMSFNFIAVLSMNDIIASKPRSLGAFGPVMMTSRKDYKKVGGHKAIRKSIVEDVEIGRLYLEKGIKVTNLLGSDLIKFRMYPKGSEQLFEGYVKNMASGAIQIGIINFLAIFFWFYGIYSSFFSICYNFWHLIYYFLFVFQFYFLNKNTGDYFIYDALLYPLHFIFFLIVFSFSIFRKFILRSIHWKDRKIHV